MLTKRGEARRRLLLSSAHAALLYLPLMRMFRESDALAADANTPKMIFTYFPTGWRGDTFWPMRKDTGPISNWPGVISSIEQLGLKEDFLLMYGLNFHGSYDHNGGLTQVLGGWGGCGLWPGANSRYQGKPINGMTLEQMYPTPYSVDQQIFDKIGGGTPVNCGVATNRVVFPEPISWKKNGIQNKSENNPKSTFDRLFGNFKAGGGSVMQDDAQKKVAMAEKRIIDFVKDDLKKIEGSLGSEDKIAFQSHVAGIDEINAEINQLINKPMQPEGPMSSTCDPELIKKFIPADVSGEWFLNENNLAKVFQIQRAIIIQALACNLTRIAIWQIGGGHSTSQLRAEGVGPKGEDHHSMSHSGGEAFMDVQRGHIREIAKIAAEMKNMKVGDKSLLDSTLIYGGSCSGDTGHSPNTIPSFILGSLGGKVKTGQLINLQGRGYNHVLVTLAHLMGATDINQVGNMKWSGPLKEILT